MIANAKTGVPSRDARIRKQFRPYSEKMDLLFLETDKADLQVNNLEETLDAGEHIYWNLERDESGNITRVIPFSTRMIVRNLRRLAAPKQEKVTDVFADFNARL